MRESVDPIACMTEPRHTMQIKSDPEQINTVIFPDVADNLF